jgi:hypothetical protein
MKIEQQVCTYKQGILLKELGVKQESVFYSDHIDNFYVMWDNPQRLRLSDRTIHDGTTVGEFFSRFTVGELGIVLPPGYDTMRSVTAIVGVELYHGYNNSGMDILNCKPFQSEAECRAAMLIYLLESKLITPEEVNNRLKQ